MSSASARFTIASSPEFSPGTTPKATISDLQRQALNLDNMSNSDCDELDDKFKNRLRKHGIKRKKFASSVYGRAPHVDFGPKAAINKSQVDILEITDPASQRLTWIQPPITVLVLKKPHDSSLHDPYRRIIDWLITKKKMAVIVEEKELQNCGKIFNGEFSHCTDKIRTYQSGIDNLNDRIDLIVCLGGDGTLIYAAQLFQGSCPPIVAFHLGSLGFLTPLNFDSFPDILTTVLNGNVSLVLRSRLRYVICEDDEGSATLSGQVLNEVVVSSAGSLLSLDLFVDDQYVTTIQGDGLIISTATGSTAYAMSAGSALVHPNVPAILICPICPHSLSMRPIVLPGGVQVAVRLSPSARTGAWVTPDGRNRQELRRSQSVRITVSTRPVPCVCSDDSVQDWFHSLAECLNWNVRKAQKPLEPHLPSLASVSDFGGLRIDNQRRPADR